LEEKIRGLEVSKGVSFYFDSWASLGFQRQEAMNVAPGYRFREESSPSPFEHLEE
jgi:hypothetical protein